MERVDCPRTAETIVSEEECDDVSGSEATEAEVEPRPFRRRPTGPGRLPRLAKNVEEPWVPCTITVDDSHPGVFGDVCRPRFRDVASLRP